MAHTRPDVEPSPPRAYRSALAGRTAPAAPLENRWPHRLARSRTPGSHPGNRGSNPLGVISPPLRRGFFVRSQIHEATSACPGCAMNRGPVVRGASGDPPEHRRTESRGPIGNLAKIAHPARGWRPPAGRSKGSRLTFSTSARRMGSPLIDHTRSTGTVRVAPSLCSALQHTGV